MAALTTFLPRARCIEAAAAAAAGTRHAEGHGEGHAEGYGRLGRGLRVPLDDALFWAVLRRGWSVQPCRAPLYVEALCLAPHPDRGYFAFPMTALAADQLAAAWPAFAGEGLMGQWRLTRSGGALTLSFVAPQDAATFVATVTRRGINPPWLEPCYACLAPPPAPPPSS